MGNRLGNGRRGVSVHVEWNFVQAIMNGYSPWHKNPVISESSAEYLKERRHPFQWWTEFLKASRIRMLSTVIEA